MLSAIVAKLLSTAGFGFLDRVLVHLERKSDSEVERAKIESGRQAAANAEAASVVKAGMQHKAFWIPWLLAAVPLSAWFAWGVTDSMLNGALPDVATLPPQLKEYADIVWGNIFYVGGGVAAVGTIANALRGKR